MAMGTWSAGKHREAPLAPTSGTLGEAREVKSSSTRVCLESLFTASKGMKSEMWAGEGLSQCLLGRIQSAYPGLATVLKPISHEHRGEVRECQKTSEELG